MTEAREPGFYWVQELSTSPSRPAQLNHLGWLQIGVQGWLEPACIGPQIPNAEIIEKLWAVAHAMKRIPQCKKHVPLRSPLCVHCQLNARIEELAALGPLPEEQKA